MKTARACKKCGTQFECEPSRRGIYCSVACSTGENRTHGRSYTSEHVAHRDMKSRCFNPNHRDYPLYGARGITVCERWLTFDNFFADMGLKPGKGYSIDRIDNDGNYEPSNCRWATWLQQGRNRRGTYTAEDDRKLREAIALGYSYRQMAAHVGKTIGSVQGRAERLGLGSGRSVSAEKCSQHALQHHGEVG